MVHPKKETSITIIHFQGLSMLVSGRVVDPAKIMGWKMNFLLGPGPFSGANSLLVSGSVGASYEGCPKLWF